MITAAAATQARVVPDLRLLALMDFLEWLDENEIKGTGWKYPDRTHEETAQRYLALRGPSWVGAVVA